MELGWFIERRNTIFRASVRPKKRTAVLSPEFMLLYPIPVNTRCINDKFKKLYLR